MLKKAFPPCIGITIGEPSGIGPEIIRKALRHPLLPRGFRYEVIGSAEGIAPGKLTKRSARVAWGALEAAVEGWKAGRYQGIVTGPIHKENMAGIGFPFPGHTEFFAKRCGIPQERAVMVMTDRKLRVALVSAHCSLTDAIRAVRGPRIIAVAKEVSAFLQKTGIPKPRLAVAGLNPHAGEGGLFGNQEAKIMAPAVRRLQEAGMDVTGPHSPDTVFHRAARGEFDAVICMYHDQGLIPFKLLAFATGVNVTLGLPLIRTSPDHGTALDLAGKGKADARSLVEAIRLAAKLVKAR